MKAKTVVITLSVVFALIAGAFLIGIAAAFFAGSSKSGGSFLPFSKGIGIVTVEGTIFDSQEIVEDIEDFRKDSSIAAIIIRIDSPGGSAAASQEIMSAALKARDEKPVIASMGTVAASGGYYLALGASKIVANSGTVTGSIGVRLEHLMLKDLLAWAKIHHETLKSGKFKDIGTFERPLSDEERALLQGLLTDIHAQFKNAISSERNIPIEEVEKFADGRVFTGREALELKLIDQIGGFTDAVELAAGLSKIKGEPNLVYPKRYRYEWIGKFVEGTLGSFFKYAASMDMGKLPLYKANIF